MDKNKIYKIVYRGVHLKLLSKNLIYGIGFDLFLF